MVATTMMTSITAATLLNSTEVVTEALHNHSINPIVNIKIRIPVRINSMANTILRISVKALINSSNQIREDAQVRHMLECSSAMCTRSCPSNHGYSRSCYWMLDKNLNWFCKRTEVTLLVLNVISPLRMTQGSKVEALLQFMT
jgi:hypothetical protein